MVTFDGRFGFIDTSGNLRIRPQFQGIAGRFSYGLCGVHDSIGWTYIDTTGKPITGERYAMVREFSEGLGLVTIKPDSLPYELAYLDTNGKRTLTLTGARQAEPFSGGMAKVRSHGGSTGFVDKNGEWIIEPQYSEAHFWTHDLCPVLVDGLWGFIRRNGSLAIVPTYPWVEWHWWEGLNRFKTQDSLMGLQDTAGRVVISAQYNWLGSPGEGFIPFKRRDQVGYLRYDGTQAFTVPYRIAESFNEGLAVVSDGDFLSGPFGYIDTTGALTIPPTFERADGFGRGVARVCTKGNRWGLIDRRGNFVVPPQYADISYPLKEHPTLVQITIQYPTDASDFFGGPLTETYMRIGGDTLWLPE